MARDTSGSRERLLDSAVHLFGERGYRGTTVGDIEARAGLSPRAGAFYRHFASKEEAFRAALERWIDDVAAFPRSVGELLPLDDLRSELTVVARGTLQLLERQRQLFRFLARDSAEFPELVAQVHDDLVARGYGQMMEFVSARAPQARLSKDQLRALAAIALGSLVHYRQDEAVYGHSPAGAKEDAFVRAWVDVWLCWFDHAGPASG
ncbi:MAG: TetR/AcrR family transcriptional regulator [Actinobacteria bacterium]|nr:TetR/AcrR family transcriptional regulator [Actinomycetota bacterium]